MINQPSEENEDPITTKQFWNVSNSRMSVLFRLATILLSIPESQAFKKRFFSVCGVICKKRAGNMSDDLKKNRAFFKCN